MTGVGIISASIAHERSTTPAAVPAGTDAEASKASTENGTRVSSGQAPLSTGQQGRAQESAASDSSDTVKQLQRQIQELQKQLQQQQQALAKLQASDMNEEAEAAAVAAAQAQLSSTSAALQTATAALLQVLTEEGGASSGSMVSTSV